jgi:diguanylate cyclase (GGDEF)-like protein
MPLANSAHAFAARKATALQPQLVTPPMAMSAVPPHPGADLEAEFRTWYYSTQTQRAQTSLALAQLLIFSSVAVDLLGSGATPQNIAAVIKLLLISPLLLVTLWITRSPRWRQYFPHFMCASIIAVGVAFCVINTGGPGMGFGLRYDALVLITVFTYFLGGLASTLACATGLALLAAHLALGANRNVTLEQLIYESLFLLAINALGMLSTTFTERSVREAFWRFQSLTQLSELDPLTQLTNRRGFDRRYAELWDRALRENQGLAIAFVDLDHFKNVNDHFGHEAGDEALRQVAGVMRQMDPRPELTARLGGDELVAVWYGIDRTQAENAASQLPRSVEALGLRNEAGSGHVLTISVGLTLCQPQRNGHPGDCLRRADQALYGAKQAGRNRLALA